MSNVDLEDSQPEIVSFCFRSRVHQIRGAGRGFYLQGYDPHVHIRAVGARLSPEDHRCVLASFAPGSPVPDYTLAVAGQAAVSGRGGRVNMVRSVPLTGSQGKPADGRTAAPELVRTTADPAANQLTYYFDVARLAEPDASDAAGGGSGAHQPSSAFGEVGTNPALAGIPANAFGYYTRGGRPVIGDVVEVRTNAVIVGFQGIGADVREAVRPFVMAGATRDFHGHDNLLGALNELTEAPDLIGVAARTDSPGDYEFTFDQPVRSPQADRFQLYTDSGDRLAGTSARVLDIGTTVRVTVEGAPAIAAQLLRAGVTPAAVHSSDARGVPNTIGNLRIPGRVPPAGPTAGPDLMTIHLDRHTGRVTFTFDEPIDPASTCLPQRDARQCRKRFFLLAADNRIVRPHQIFALDGASVTLLFRKRELQGSRVLGAVAGAVRGLDDQPNPVASLPVPGRRR